MHQMKRDADVIVVGAGPAGAVCALLLARGGHDVLLIDRAAFPRAKPCGDCMSAGARPLLDRLGLLDAVLALPHARLTHWRIAGPDGSRFDAAFDDTDAIAVERTLLDDALLRQAIAGGVRFLPHTAVTGVLRNANGHVIGVSTRDADFHAPLTVGADGLRSVIAARLGVHRRPPRLRKLSLTFHVDAAVCQSGTGEMHSGDGVCVGVAPLAADATRTNVTVVADADRFGRAVADDAIGFATRTIDSLPLLRGRVDGAALQRAERLASGPFDRPAARVVFDGAALVGDAAGYYDPFTGQGVFQAIASAELLARTVDAALSRSGTAASAIPATPLEPYARARRRLLRGPRAVQHAIEFILARPTLATAAINRIAAAPEFARAIISVTGDVDRVSTLLSPRALSSLLAPPGFREKNS